MSNGDYMLKLTDKLDFVLYSKYNDVKRSNYTNIKPNQSIYMFECKNITISNTTINHLILSKCININIDAKIKGNVVIDTCDYVEIKQNYLTNVTLKNMVFGCQFNSVGTLDATDCMFTRQSFYSRYDFYKGVIAKSVEHLIVDKIHTNDSDFGEITALCYNAPLRTYYKRNGMKRYKHNNEHNMYRCNVNKYSRHDDHKTKLNDVYDITFYSDRFEHIRRRFVSDYDYNFNPNNKPCNKDIVIDDKVFNELIESNKIKHLKVYIRNHLIINDHKHLESLTVDCIEQYDHHDYDIDCDNKYYNDRLDYDEYGVPFNDESTEETVDTSEEDKYSLSVQNKSIDVRDDYRREYYAIIGKQKLIVNNCPMLKELNVICTTKYINYEVYGCDNLENINIKYPKHCGKAGNDVNVNKFY